MRLTASWTANDAPSLQTLAGIIRSANARLLSPREGFTEDHTAVLAVRKDKVAELTEALKGLPGLRAIQCADSGIDVAPLFAKHHPTS